MKFDLTQPCNDCPFRNDINFPLGRAKEIATVLLVEQGTFSCHKTTTEKGRTAEHPEAQHCAGAMIVLEKMEKPNQMMRWMERIGRYDRFKLNMDSPVYEDLSQFVEACSGESLYDEDDEEDYDE